MSLVQFTKNQLKDIFYSYPRDIAVDTKQFWTSSSPGERVAGIAFAIAVVGASTVCGVKMEEYVGKPMPDFLSHINVQKNTVSVPKAKL